MAVICYVRVSTDKQSVMHQRHEILKFLEQNHRNPDKWVMETISSRQPLYRRQLGELLEKIGPNDILIASELSRFGRSLVEIFHILEKCMQRGCEVWTIKEDYKLGDNIQSKIMAFAFGLSAEIERNLISQRTKASLANIRASGRKLGRPENIEFKKKLERNKRMIQNMMNRGVTKYKISKTLGVQPATLQRFLDRMNLYK